MNSAKPKVNYAFGEYTLEIIVLVLVIVVARIISQPWIDFSYSYYYSLTGYEKNTTTPLLLLALSLTVVGIFIFFIMEILGLYVFDRNSKYYAFFAEI